MQQGVFWTFGGESNSSRSTALAICRFIVATCTDSCCRPSLPTTPTPYDPGHQFIRLAQDGDGVTVEFANGVRVACDVVVGADGNASAVRSHLFPGEAPVFTGQVSFRALIPWNALPPAIAERKYAMYPAPQRTLLHYPLRGGRIMNPIGTGRSASWEEEGWAIPATNEEFAAAYSDFAPEVVAMIRSIPAGALFKWGLRDREPLVSWTKGRVTMLGDAAHPMTPFLGQGACIAIEDGLVLGRAFELAGSIDEALARDRVGRAGCAAQTCSSGRGNKAAICRPRARDRPPSTADCWTTIPQLCRCDDCRRLGDRYRPSGM